jgi:hypothetical protein
MSRQISPFEQYLHDQIKPFKTESARLGREEPLRRYKAIFDAFALVQKDLGTLRHDVALDALKGQFKSVRHDIAAAVRHAWMEFWQFRSRASEDAKREREQRVAGEAHLRELAARLERLRAEDSPLAEIAADVHETSVRLQEIKLDMPRVWRAMSWTHLWVEWELCKSYASYVVARFRVFLQFHLFIFLLPILVLGIGYSIVSKGMVEALASAAALSPGYGLIIVLAAYVFKKYVIDKHLKSLQKRVEDRLYRPLSFNLLVARTLALQLHTMREQPEAPTDSTASE